MKVTLGNDTEHTDYEKLQEMIEAAKSSGSEE